MDAGVPAVPHADVRYIVRVHTHRVEIVGHKSAGKCGKHTGRYVDEKQEKGSENK